LTVRSEGEAGFRVGRLATALEVEPADIAEFRRALSGDAPADED
jgi:hypothetical protein